jgi:RNA polymerase sigma factor for flagellar operon FliA
MNRADPSQSRSSVNVLRGDRERIIQEFTHVIRSMAHRLAFRLPAYLDAEDLVSVGIIGLMDAMDKYDPTREAKFKTYAEFRIRGAMLDEIRSMDWIPRSVHERVALLQKTYSELLNRHGRPPTDEEVAAELKMSLHELDEFLTRARGAIVVSLEDLGVKDQDGYQTLGFLTDSSQPDPLASLVHGRERQILCQSIQELPEKERLVLTLYYFEELTMKEIGQILKVTESRVCQIHSKAILHLKARLQPVET